jgi:hypothetical protein
MDPKRGEQAFELDQKIKTNELQRRTLLAENARLLSTVFDKKLYKEILGFEDGEWAGYLSDVEVFYSRNEVNSYIRVYKKLTGELGLDPENWVQFPITRLADVLPILTAENAEDWFSKIGVLTSRDWAIELGKAKGKITEEDEHKHQMIDYRICKVCGKKEKHHHDDTKTAS